jgi:hypothetical protein
MRQNPSSKGAALDCRYRNAEPCICNDIACPYIIWPNDTDKEQYLEYTAEVKITRSTTDNGDKKEDGKLISPWFSFCL